MTRSELMVQIGLTLEDFDSNRGADMSGFINEIIDNVEKYTTNKLEKALNDCEKNSILNYLKRALANER